MSLPTSGKLPAAGAVTLPLTGAGVVVGNTTVTVPTLAATAVAMILLGLLILRFTRPARMATTTPGRPGRAHPRVWRRGNI